MAEPGTVSRRARRQSLARFLKQFLIHNFYNTVSKTVSVSARKHGPETQLGNEVRKRGLETRAGCAVSLRASPLSKTQFLKDSF